MVTGMGWNDIERRLAALKAERRGCGVCRGWPISALCVQHDSGALEPFPVGGETWPAEDPLCWACGRRPLCVHILGAEWATLMQGLLKASLKDTPRRQTGRYTWLSPN
jgi:hypothetical protein